jgi:hypothetical protein
VVLLGWWFARRRTASAVRGNHLRNRRASSKFAERSASKRNHRASLRANRAIGFSSGFPLVLLVARERDRVLSQARAVDGGHAVSAKTEREAEPPRSRDGARELEADVGTTAPASAAATHTRDSLDELLRQVARVSERAPVGLRSMLPLGASLSGGRLSLLRRIGEGGMGVVYEAFDAERRTRVALKTLNRMDADSVYRLKNEFRSLANVVHPNLVQLHELFAEDGVWFFTMELVHGERFDQWVRPGHPEGSLDQNRLRIALPQLLAAIATIHAAGKLHRDLKPSNVLVTCDGRVIVLDFGLAVDPELGGVGQTIADGSVSGTPAYMAPEQAAGKSATQASDYYALGVMLFEVLTGELPFAGRAHDMLVDKQRSDAPSASAGSPRATRDLASICDALLARNPQARPSAQALQASLGGGPRTSAAELGRASAVPERDPLLGREPETVRLRATYEATLEGQPVVMFVSGQSGIGKSALVTHFLDELRAEGKAAVLAGRCYERESVPFKGIDSLIDAVSRYLRKLSNTEASALMPREVYALARIFPVLGRIDAVAQAPSRDVSDPQELRHRAFGAFGELLARIRDRRPLVLCIDDAHWLDRDAVTFLEYLLGHPEPVPAMLVLSYRSEDAASRSRLAQLRKVASDNPELKCNELSLGALSFGAAQGFALRLLGATGATRAAEVALEAGGSPFFVDALCRQAQRSSADSRLTLHEVVLAHVQDLSSDARRLLDVLAVAGRPLPIEIALEAAAASHAGSDALHAERLLRSSGSGQERSVECYHDKIREHVAQALSVERQRAVHASLLAVLQRRSDADDEHLAMHAQGAGDREAAARYAIAAAATAGQSMAFDQAALFYGRALELDTRGVTDRRELQTKLGEALANAGRSADAARVYLEAARGATDEQALELCRRATDQVLASGHLSALGFGPRTAICLDRFAPAADLTALIDAAWRRGDAYSAVLLTASSATARLVQGDADGAARLARTRRGARGW